MFKYYNALQNRSGDALRGYLVRLFDANGAVVPIFADPSGTPISTASGVENAAKSDDDGMVRFYVPDGVYDVRHYDTNGVFAGSESGVPMQVGASFYPTVEEGLSRTIIGQAFWVNSGGSLVAYQNDGAVATPLPSSPVSSVNGHVGDVVLDKADVGLENVSDLAPEDLPISAATQAALDDKAGKATATTSAAGLMAPADKAKLDNIAAGATANQSDAYLLNRANHTGSQAISTVTGLQTALDGKEATLTQGTGITIDRSNPAAPVISSTATGGVTSVNGRGGAVTLTKADVGLSNVDNTSDAAKPISTATQTALNAKANSAVTISAGSGLTGGGTLAANRTIALSGTSLASLALADSAVQPSYLGDLATVNFPAVPVGNVLNDLGNWVPQGGGGGGGGQVNSIQQGTGIAVDATDPVNPGVSLNAAAISALTLAQTAVQPDDLGNSASLDVGAAAGTVAAGNHTHPAATTGAAGFMSAADKVKLNGIAAGATANTGTVTSVGLSVPTGFSVTNSPVTGAGALTISYQTGYQGYTTDEASKLADIEANADVTTAALVASKFNAVPPDSTVPLPPQYKVIMCDGALATPKTVYWGGLSAYLLNRANHTGSQAISTITNLQAALNDKADLVGGLIPVGQLPAIAITDSFVVNSQAAMLALAVQVGDIAVRTDLSKTFVLKTEPATALANWVELLSPTSGVSSVSASGANGLTLNVANPTTTPAITLGGTLTIAGGGTGATDSAAARAALGAVGVSTSNLITGGMRALTANLNISGGMIQPSLLTRNMFLCTNSGAFSLYAPSDNNAYTATIHIENVSGAGDMTPVNFDYVDPDGLALFNTTVGAKFIFQIISHGAGKKCLYIMKASA